MKHIFKNLKKSKSNQHSRTWQTTTNILDQWEFCQSKMISPHWILLYWYLCGSPSLFLSVVPTWLDTRYSDFFWSWWDRIENTNWHVKIISTLYFIPWLFPKQWKKKSFSPFSAKIRPLGLIGICAVMYNWLHQKSTAWYGKYTNFLGEPQLSRHIIIKCFVAFF